MNQRFHFPLGKHYCVFLPLLPFAVSFRPRVVRNAETIGEKLIRGAWTGREPWLAFLTHKAAFVEVFCSGQLLGASAFIAMAKHNTGVPLKIHGGLAVSFQVRLFRASQTCVRADPQTAVGFFFPRERLASGQLSG